MNTRPPLGRGDAGPGEFRVQIVDCREDSTTLAGLFAGAHVECTPDVGTAIDLAAGSQPDLVVLRVALDEVAGADALRRLHAVAPDCRVVLLPVRPANERSASAGDGTDGGAFGGSTGLPPDPEVVVRSRALRPCAESAGLGRQVVRSACFDALLVGTELVTNAVTHAHTAVGLTVRARPTSIRIEVCDGLPERPLLRPADVSAAGGRGFMMVDALCSAWGIDPSANGKTIWAHLVSPGP